MPQIVEPVVEPVVVPIAGDSNSAVSPPGSMDFSQTQNSGLFVLLEDI
ncbi:hypothetical protein [Mesorhizobium sp. M2D.F.Ca.ET.148.01.1.1]|nr:hypothetical protein [Mesorhizobium sp. M2D.F.Ca.ET.148.01.1.1]